MLPIHKTLKTRFDYDEIPPGYYYRVMLEGPQIQRFWHRKKFEAVAQRIPAGASVIDFGCSAGSFLMVLGQLNPSVRAVGVDIGSSQIEFARAEVEPQFPDGRVRFVVLPDTSGKLPFDDASVDVVTSIEVIEHVHPAIVHRFLAEARRVLKPGGRLLLTTPNYRSMWPLIEIALQRVSKVRYEHQHINKFTPNSAVKAVEAAGFEVQDVSTLFVLAPFLAAASPKLAQAAHQLEVASKARVGSILLIDAKPLGDAEFTRLFG
jgi:2-polyprenyl-3-methyl-5-hydroxy-6-metoxy-1,4-benzoquinol methylase